jgi:protease IV
MSEHKRSGAGLWIGLAVGFVLLVAVALGLAWWLGGEKVAESTILEIDFGRQLIEYQPDDPLAAIFLDKQMTLRQFVETLHAAAEDDNVVALVAEVTPAGGLGIAQIDELRDAIEVFRAAGKPAIAFTDSFGEVQLANSAYYLASAFDEIYIQPSGDAGLVGARFESPFVEGTLEKLSIEAEFAQRHEYKNAMNLFTESSFTEPHREAMQTLADSFVGHLVAEVAAARGLTPEQVRAAIDRAPFIGQQAVDERFVDGLLYRDQVYDRVRALARGEAELGQPPAAAELAEISTDDDDEDDDDVELLYLHKYAGRADGPWSDGDKAVAVVYGVGAVVRGESQFDPLSGDLSMGGESVARAIRNAIEDDDVEAIILRVDSPGGSYVASDMVWREVARARAHGKPVIASMGNLAASGGYFVAMGADKIVAQPTTITGSIGVLGGKLVTRETWNKVGITWDAVQVGEHADMWSSMKQFDPSEWAKFNAWLDRVYEDFTTKVAEGRDLPIERVRQIAKGRVWSGVDAKRLGLVDELGGLSTALTLAREAAGIEADEKVRLVTFPRHQDPFQALFGEGPESSEERAAVVAATRALEAVRPLAVQARRVGMLGPQAGVLTMPEVVMLP